MNFQLGKYRTTVSKGVILEWLKRGYSVEQIKMAASEIKLEVEQENVLLALALYEEWKKKHPNQKKTKCFRPARDEDR